VYEFAEGNIRISREKLMENMWVWLVDPRYIASKQGFRISTMSEPSGRDRKPHSGRQVVLCRMANASGPTTTHTMTPSVLQVKSMYVVAYGLCAYNV
jgi:hypothetical protein